MRRATLVLGGTALLLSSSPAAAAAPVPVVVIEGRGHGHGVGMAQDGAFWMGKGGASTPQILAQFYPGTTLGRAGGEVRVAVLTSPSNAATVRFPSGGEVRDAREGGQSPGFPLRVRPGGEARFRFDGRQFVAEVAGPSLALGEPTFSTAQLLGPPTTTTTVPGATTTTRPGLLPGLTLPSTLLPPATLPLTPSTTAAPATTAPAAPTPGRATSSRSLWAVPNGGGTVAVADRGAQYRGVVQAVGGSPLRLVNHVDVEQYLRGMGEVRDPSWPPASLRAQAIAARTYALRAVSGGGELCDTQQCQVYLGAQAEYAAMDKAVSATRGQVVLYRRALASTVYSSNGGGVSASPEEGFGTPGAGYPYLRAAAYTTKDPQPWSVTVAVRDLAARVGYRGRVTAVHTQTGPSGRVVAVVLEGQGGARTVGGIDFDHALGLRSTLFTVRLDQAAVAPPPPPTDGGAVQGLPGEPAAAPGDPAAAADASAAAGPAPAAAASLTATRAAAGSGDPSPAARLSLFALAALLLAAACGGITAVRFGPGAGRGPGRPAPAPAPPEV